MKLASGEILTENQSAMFGWSSTSCMNSVALLEWFKNAQRFFTWTLYAHTNPSHAPTSRRPPGGCSRE